MTPEQRFDKYWEHIKKTWTFGNAFTSEKEDKEIEDAMKSMAQNAFINAFKICSSICEAWYNEYRFNGNVNQIVNVWQTINGNHPDKEVKI